MLGIEKVNQKQYFKNKINDNPELWDLSVLINIFHDHYESLFCNALKLLTYIEEDFSSIKAKPFLLSIKDIRNKRAHDSPITSREAHRLADTAQLFFELTKYTEVI